MTVRMSALERKDERRKERVKGIKKVRAFDNGGYSCVVYAPIDKRRVDRYTIGLTGCKIVNCFIVHFIDIACCNHR